MRPLIAAAPILRAESPETVLASTAAGPLWEGAAPWAEAGLCASALSVGDESSAHAQAARTLRIVVLPSDLFAVRHFAGAADGVLGKWKAPSSMATLASAFSICVFWWSVAPFVQESCANGR